MIVAPANEAEVFGFFLAAEYALFERVSMIAMKTAESFFRGAVFDSIIIN